MEQKPFFFFLSISFVAHVFLILVFSLSSHLRGIFKKDLEIKNTAIRVDMIGLPDLPTQSSRSGEKKQSPVLTLKTPEKTLEAKKNKEVAKLKAKQKAKKLEAKKRREAEKLKAKKREAKKQELEKLKAKELEAKKGEAQKKEAQKREAEKKELEAKNKALNKDSPQKNKGNRLSEGQSTGDGELNPEQLSEINTYFSNIESRMKAYWNLPKHLLDQALIAQIEVKINNQGEMIAKKIVQSSGNDLFDSQALKAMEKASPYPPPPKSVQKIIQDGIVFTLNSKN